MSNISTITSSIYKYENNAYTTINGSENIEQYFKNHLNGDNIFILSIYSKDNIIAPICECKAYMNNNDVTNDGIWNLVDGGNNTINNGVITIHNSSYNTNVIVRFEYNNMSVEKTITLTYSETFSEIDINESSDEFDNTFTIVSSLYKYENDTYTHIPLSIIDDYFSSFLDDSTMMLSILSKDKISENTFSCTAYSNFTDVTLEGTWDIIVGKSFATINSSTGLVNVSQNASNSNIVVKFTYLGLSVNKSIMVGYVKEQDENTNTETHVVNNNDGTTTQTQIVIIANNDGTTTSHSSTVTYDEDGNIVGSQEGTTNTVVNPDGSTQSQTTVIIYDDSGNVSGSSENTTNINNDGSSSSSTTNYNADGDPTNTTNNSVDTSGNSHTKDIEYNDNGDPIVTGYDIDTSNNDDGYQNFNKDGVNTDYYAFDLTHGFEISLHFTINFIDQPTPPNPDYPDPNKDEGKHNILTMKRSNPQPWYGFQIRMSAHTDKKIQLGIQYSTGGNQNLDITPGRSIDTNTKEYDIYIKYDPTVTSGNRFIAKELIGNRTIHQSTNKFPDTQELKYLRVCIGYALDTVGNPYRFANINVYNFNINRI